MKLFVTGAAGYVGSHTVLELLNGGHEVMGFDNLSNGDLRTLDQVQKITGKNIDFKFGDIRDQNLVQAELKKFSPDAIIHFAALKSVTDSFNDPVEYYDVNVNGSISLLKAVNSLQHRNLIFSSSATVYGFPNYLPLDEDHPKSPTNPYGQAKITVENILKDWVNSNINNRAVCLRYFNPIGAHWSGAIGESPRGRPNNIMPYISQVASGKLPYIKIFGNDYPTRDGTGERDYIHVTDLAICHKKAVELILNLERFEVLNVGTGKGTTVKELVTSFENVIGVALPSLIKDRRQGDIASSFADTKLAEIKLKYKCKRSVLRACKDEWNWKIKNIHNS